jgi:endonuclease/exonuclease/phosphatase family metal-dependent hydrolase
MRTILLGDFNMQIPPFNYPYEHSAVNQKRKETFEGWLIPTAGISRHFIDHIAMPSELRVNTLQYISRFDSDDSQLSDHNGVVIDVLPGPS